jgi:hypothetical protein
VVEEGLKSEERSREGGMLGVNGGGRGCLGLFSAMLLRKCF